MIILLVVLVVSFQQLLAPLSIRRNNNDSIDNAAVENYTIYPPTTMATILDSSIDDDTNKQVEEEIDVYPNYTTHSYDECYGSYGSRREAD